MFTFLVLPSLLPVFIPCRVLCSSSMLTMRYATTAITAAMLREVASRGGVPMQEVIVRNDSHCGSTIGPMLSAKLGLRTVGEWAWLSLLHTPTSRAHSNKSIQICIETRNVGYT